MPEHTRMCAGAAPQPKQASKAQGKALAEAPAAPRLVTGPPVGAKNPRAAPAAAQGSQSTVKVWHRTQ